MSEVNKNEFECMDVIYIYEYEDGKVTVLEDLHGNEPGDAVFEAAEEHLADCMGLHNEK